MILLLPYLLQWRFPNHETLSIFFEASPYRARASRPSQRERANSIQPLFPACADRQELGIRSFPLRDVVVGLVVAHFGTDDGEFLVHQFVIPDQLRLGFSSLRSHRPFRSGHAQRAFRAPVALDEI